MKKYVGAFLAVGVVSAVAISAVEATAQESKQISDAKACTQRVADAKQARADGPDISDRAGKAFDEIVALAEQRCAEKSYKNAGQLLHIAKSMVASE